MSERPTRAPVPLIVQQDGGLLGLHPEGAAALRGPAGDRRPVLCLAVAGLYRTGKSFLLNRIAKNLGAARGSGGFGVGKTTTACTRGIWIQDTGVELNGGRVILMDSEGLASVDQDEQHDAKIFCLALLLSSMFFLNSQGVIDESAIDRLYLIGEITKRVCVSAGTGAAAGSGGGEGDEQTSRLSDFFPPFVWLLRDFHLELEHNGRPMTRGEYLEQSLADRPTTTSGGGGGGRRAAERNDTRRAIRSLFRRRQCFTLVRPALQEEDLRRAGELGDDALRPEFLSEMRALTSLISSQMPRKSLLGTDLNGAQLVNLASRYLSAINGGAVPEITGAWQSVIADTYREALAAAVERHKKNTSSAGGLSGVVGGDYLERSATGFEEDVRSLERAAREDALSLFETKTRGCAKTAAGERQRLAAEQELRLAMFESESRQRKERGERCAAAAERLLERDLPSALFQGAERASPGGRGKSRMDVDQCFAALDDGLEAFRKASSTEKDLSCLLPEAPRNVCLALQRRVLPALRSAIRSRQTRWQIAESDLSRKLDISETRVAAQEAKCEDLEHEVRQLRQQLRDAEQTITASRVRREFAEKSAESIKELHRAEVAKRTEAQQVAVSEGNKRREAEAKLREDTSQHRDLQARWRAEQGARRTEVDRLSVAQWLEEQLLQVEVAAERERHQARTLRLREERDAMQYRLGELTRRITILPEIYQQRIFGSDDLPEDADFLDLVSGVDGDEPSLADGCKTQ